MENEINLQVSDRFVNFINDWDYETYLLFGGYGSGKSWHVALKIILACLKEKRKVLVCRNVRETIKESCFDLFKDILNKMNILEDEENARKHKRSINKVVAISSPMQIRFPNGSKIIFKGLDNAQKIKSIHGISIVWIEEASEIKFEAYEELQTRARENNVNIFYFLSFNPVGKENWTYNHFFRRLNDDGSENVIVDEEKLYKVGTMVKGKTYYHHSVPYDNPFLQQSYIDRLEAIKEYDPYLHAIATKGVFGASGTRVLPQFEVATNAKEFKEKVNAINESMHFIGFDFGFEESFNAVVKCAVDDKEKILYIYDEIYINHVTDDKMVSLPEMQEIKESGKVIYADAAEPKTIQYYRQQGFNIFACKKFAGSRLANTRKVKRFKKIICSPKCKNGIRELKDLTYKKDAKGNIIYDEFMIDPHIFSAIWYALDKYTVADLKKYKGNSKAG